MGGESKRRGSFEIRVQQSKERHEKERVMAEASIRALKDALEDEKQALKLQEEQDRKAGIFRYRNSRTSLGGGMIGMRPSTMACGISTNK